MLVDSALLLLIGFALAGLLHLVLHSGNLRRLVSGSPRAQVFKTALIGIPLPLCSCSVLPIAHQLREGGVSRGGTVSFLISTPESGVDSMLLTYTLMDPVMTVARPIAAFLTAMTAGSLEAAVSKEEKKAPTPLAMAQPAAGGCCHCSGEAAPVEPQKPPLFKRIISGVKYGFTDLLPDLAVFLVIGYVLAGLVVALFGGSEMLRLPEMWVTGWGGYLGAIMIGLPLYICATSSTPLAAALLVAGFSPGAVLVFLLVGPATNVASIAVVSKILKGWAVVRYLISIVVVAIFSGIVVDWVYTAFDFDPLFRAGVHQHGSAWYDDAAAFLLTAILVTIIAKKIADRFRRPAVSDSALTSDCCA